MAMKSRYQRLEWLLQSQKVRWVILRGLPKQRATLHLHCPSRPYRISFKPNKAVFCCRVVQMHFIQRHCCILTQFVPKFRCVIKSTSDFLSNIDMSVTWEHILEWIDEPASHENKLGSSISHLCQFKRLLYNACCTTTIGFISMKFTGNAQLHIFYICAKIHAN